ncbi:DUF3108 domain-containing protein [Photobacterium sp. TY1-4]|uniref:DUF3108 domain-containing protein n=1 Tax=Photobacterium sp. TY1-4 TaxID=2899122 RepID=UPI0021C05728|nr:DUF3108 domain-containing protein [Photobacterium sp. TY1-4]UXI00192.1 DUF3108 domain-containing protein [Photobacterium sp. TY1-4]
MKLQLAVHALLGLGVGLLSPSALALPAQQYHQCTKSFTYDLFLSNHRIGHYQRTLNWQGDQVQIRSYSTIDIKVSKSQFRQNSRVFWSEQENGFLTHSFERHISGLMAGQTSATFSEDGRRTSLQHEGDTLTFTSQDIPIRDGDAVGSQIRLNLLNGKKSFDFKLQGTDDVDRYYFEVKGQEYINTNFGRLKAFRVEQVRKPDRQLVMWFAPAVDYQLVKATYERRLLNLKAMLLRQDIQCPQTTATMQSNATIQSTATSQSTPSIP